MTEAFPSGPAPSKSERVVRAVAEAIAAMRYGTISLTIHDAEVVQMEITEKRRFGH